jgi:hypothetical protein
MRPTLLLLVLSLLALPAAAGAQAEEFAPPPRPTAPAALRVMTYNVRYASGASGHEDWATRLPDLAAQLQRTDLDILGTRS